MSWPEEEEEGEELLAHNQLALRADDADALVSPTKALSSRVAAGTTRRHGCGVCRACVFMPHRKARRGAGVSARAVVCCGACRCADAASPSKQVCLATKAASDVAASEEVASKSRRKRASAHKLERQLDKRRRQVCAPRRARCSL
jgi:hypothetical protein